MVCDFEVVDCWFILVVMEGEMATAVQKPAGTRITTRENIQFAERFTWRCFVDGCCRVHLLLEGGAIFEINLHSKSNDDWAGIAVNFEGKIKNQELRIETECEALFLKIDRLSLCHILAWLTWSLQHLWIVEAVHSASLISLHSHQAA